MMSIGPMCVLPYVRAARLHPGAHVVLLQHLAQPRLQLVRPVVRQLAVGGVLVVRRALERRGVSDRAQELTCSVTPLNTHTVLQSNAGKSQPIQDFGRGTSSIAECPIECRSLHSSSRWRHNARATGRT
jgi:hypothetical protein